MVDTYECEWKKVVETPELRAKYRHFINSTESDPSIEFVPVRDQKMPKPWRGQKTLDL
jgi:nitrite reductase (NADH) large subunit